jgi:hypothetical protein
VLHQYLNHRFKVLWDFADFSLWLVAFEGSCPSAAGRTPDDTKNYAYKKPMSFGLPRLSKPHSKPVSGRNSPLITTWGISDIGKPKTPGSKAL